MGSKWTLKLSCKGPNGIPLDLVGKFPVSPEPATTLEKRAKYRIGRLCVAGSGRCLNAPDGIEPRAKGPSPQSSAAPLSGCWCRARGASLWVSAFTRAKIQADKRKKLL